VAYCLDPWSLKNRQTILAKILPKTAASHFLRADDLFWRWIFIPNDYIFEQKTGFKSPDCIFILKVQLINLILKSFPEMLNIVGYKNLSTKTLDP
jgi:hypothetical protein